MTHKLLLISNKVKFEGLEFNHNQDLINNDIIKYYDGFERIKHSMYCSKLVFTDYARITEVNCGNKLSKRERWACVKVNPELLENLMNNVSKLQYFLDNFSKIHNNAEIVFIKSSKKKARTENLYNRFPITVKMGDTITYNDLFYSMKTLESNYSHNSHKVFFVDKEIIRDTNFNQSVDFLFNCQLSTPNDTQLEYLRTQNKTIYTNSLHSQWKNFPYLSIWYYLQHTANKPPSILDGIRINNYQLRKVIKKNPLLTMLRNIALSSRDNTYGAIVPKPLSREYQQKSKENILKYAKEHFISEWGEDFVDKFYTFDTIIKTCLWR